MADAAGGKEAWFDQPVSAAGAGAGAAEVQIAVEQPAPGAGGGSAGASAGPSLGAFGSKIAAELAGNALGETTKQAEGMLKLYANIDLIRPYFDVQGATVLKRLALSVVPFRPQPDLETVSEFDLYGASMAVLTCTLLIFNLAKLKHVAVLEGTLMGTAFAVAFGYWITASLMFAFLAYLFDLHDMGVVRVFAETGYAMAGYCLALILDYFLAGSPLAYMSLLVVGALCSLTLGWTLFKRTASQKHGTIVAGAAVGVHFVFLVYLKVAYGGV